MDEAIYKRLLDPLPDDLRVCAVNVGRSWNCVTLSNGASGISARLAETPEDFIKAGTPLRTAAAGILSGDVGEAAMAMAAMNAFYNTPRRLRELSASCPMDMYCTDGMELRGKTVGMIGHMSRTIEGIKNAESIYVFDFDPKPGDLPASEEDRLLPACDLVIISGTALTNHTLPRLMELAPRAQKILLGPSVPMSLGLLDAGFCLISGCVLNDPEGFIEWNRESHGNPMKFCQNYIIKNPEFK